MYQLQEEPDKTAMLENGVEFTPVATLKDEYGGVMHIMEDDYCYVLVLKCEVGFRMTPWWNTEAVAALKVMPPLKTDRESRIEYARELSAEVAAWSAQQRYHGFSQSNAVKSD